VITIEGIEQFIPFIKPLFDGLRSARDLFKRDHKKSSDHDLDIPKKTLILLPGIRPHALRWSPGTMGTTAMMHLHGELQATNTSRYNIRPSGLKLLEPQGVEVANSVLLMEGPDDLIQNRAIGRIIIGFFLKPIGQTAKPFKATVSIQDQFGNEHIVKDLMFKYAGSEPPPDDKIS
jgi:hypothetical protein